MWSSEMLNNQRTIDTLSPQRCKNFVHLSTWFHLSRKGFRYIKRAVKSVLVHWTWTCSAIMMSWYQKRHAPSRFSHESSRSSHARATSSLPPPRAWIQPYKKRTRSGGGHGENGKWFPPSIPSRRIRHAYFKCHWERDSLRARKYDGVFIQRELTYHFFFCKMII